jgi:hypothetical protein
MHTRIKAQTHVDQAVMPFMVRRYRCHRRHRVHRNSRHRPDFGDRMRQIIDWLQEHGPATDRQLCYGLGFRDMNAVRPRVTELLDSFRLREVGETKDELTGRTVRLIAIS